MKIGLLTGCGEGERDAGTVSVPYILQRDKHLVISRPTINAQIGSLISLCTLLLPVHGFHSQSVVHTWWGG